MKILLTIVIIFLLLISPANKADAALSSSTTSDVAPVKPGCEYTYIDPNGDYAGHPFKNPPQIESKNGVLSTTLNVKYAQNHIADCQVNLRSYNGELVGPTLRVHPGDKIQIKLINKLPPQTQPTPTPQLISEASFGICKYEEAKIAINTPHNFNTTNFHTHGLHVSPTGCSDNVLRVMKPKASEGDSPPEYDIEVQIPEDHPSGTFWYHAHLHGSTALQVSSGMAGALIVEGGGLDKIPAIAKAEDKIFLFQQIAYDENGEIENYDNFGPNAWTESKRRTTINGKIVPVIYMHPGEVQRWRFIHGGVRESIHVELHEKGSNFQIPLEEIAVDGIPLGKKDTWTDKPIELEPGYRSDVLVKIPSKSTEGDEYYLEDITTAPPTNLNLKIANFVIFDNFNLIPVGRNSLLVGESGAILAKVIVRGEPILMNLPNDQELAIAKKEDAPTDIIILNPDPSETVKFSFVNNNNNTYGAVDGKPFTLDNVRDLQLNNAQKWELNTFGHPFHIHVNPFQYIRKGPDGRDEKIWRDTLFLTNGQPNKINTRYTVFTGKFVLHCHILDHEDIGMMQAVEILAKQASSS